MAERTSHETIVRIVADGMVRGRHPKDTAEMLLNEGVSAVHLDSVMSRTREGIECGRRGESFDSSDALYRAAVNFGRTRYRRRVWAFRTVAAFLVLAGVTASSILILQCNPAL